MEYYLTKMYKAETNNVMYSPQQSLSPMCLLVWVCRLLKMNGYLAQSQSPSLGIIYSVVARGTIVLAQYAAHHGNFTEVSQQVLELVPTDSSSKLTYATRE